MRQPKIIVVGGGLAGLMATIRVAEAGIPVDLFSIVPVKRSHSVCAQGGINAAKKDRKSTRLNSSHSQISYAVFCLKKKKQQPRHSRSITSYAACTTITCI